MLALAEKAQVLRIEHKIGINACKLLGAAFTIAIGVLVRMREKGLLMVGEALVNLAILNPDPLPRVDNVITVRDTVARLIADVYGGKIHPRVATGLAPLFNIQLKTIETTDLERRVAQLEKAMAKEPRGFLESHGNGPSTDFETES